MIIDTVKEMGLERNVIIEIGEIFQRCKKQVIDL